MNLIPEIAEKLGVELGEEFKLKSDEVGEYDEIYRFDENAALQMKNRCGWGMSCRLAALLSGDIEIIKLPFEPKKGEKYFVVSIVDMAVRAFAWDGTTSDYCYKACGNCFRTKEDAEKHKYEIYEKLTGKKWENDND